MRRGAIQRAIYALHPIRFNAVPGRVKLVTKLHFFLSIYWLTTKLLGRPDRGGGALRDRNPPKKPRRSPRASGAENANDGKAPTRHHDGTDQHPRCTSRPNPPGDRTGRTRDVEFSDGIGWLLGQAAIFYII